MIPVKSRLMKELLLSPPVFARKFCTETLTRQSRACERDERESSFCGRARKSDASSLARH